MYRIFYHPNYFGARVTIYHPDQVKAKLGSKNKHWIADVKTMKEAIAIKIIINKSIKLFKKHVKDII